MGVFGRRGPVSRQGLVELAQSATLDEFLAQVTGYFLATNDDGSPVQLRFQTAMIEPGRVPPSRGHLQILPLQKAPNNPYSDRISIGRTANCDIVLRDPSVSKLHAQFRLQDGQLQLVDTRSQNGTWINGARLAPEQPQPVFFEDELRFGGVSAVLLDPERLYDALAA